MKKVFLFVMYIIAVIIHPFLPKRYGTWIGDDFCGWAYDSPRWKVFACIYASIITALAVV